MLSINDMPLCFDRPEQTRIQTLKNQVYKKLEDQTELAFDLFQPDERATNVSPTVLFIHGEAPPETSHELKDWQHLQDWGALVASRGASALVFQHRSSHWFSQLEPVYSDIIDLFEYLTDHAANLKINMDEVCIWVCSGSTPIALRAVADQSTLNIQRVACYYPRMSYHMIKHEIDGISSAGLERFDGHQIWNSMPPERRPALQIVRAGAEEKPEVNASIDHFLVSALKDDPQIALELLTHPTGGHFFDIFSDTNKTKEIIQKTLNFFKN